MKFADTFGLAWKTVTSNLLRTLITVAIIALGIMALVGIMTARDAMNNSIYENFTQMGSNTFVIHYQSNDFFGGGDDDGGEDVKKTSKKAAEKKSRQGQVITYRQAASFKDRFQFPAAVSISQIGDYNTIVYSEDKKTNPNVRLLGGDENYLVSSGYNLAFGRNFSIVDLQSGRNVAILGRDVAVRLFGERWRNAVDAVIRVGGNRYRVIGVLASKGASSMFSADNVVITPLESVRRLYAGSSSTLNLSVTVNNIKQMEAAIGEATGVFRQVRGLSVTDSNNFYVDRSDSLAQKLESLASYLAIAAFIIGLITLSGSAIGLMNIMLVSVNERTREIGLVKSLGAKKGAIRLQFLMESILISLMGASCGIVLGIVVGNIFSLILSTGFVIPWAWAFGGIMICTITGLLAGLYPAIKAGRLDPIVALRHE